MNKNKGFTLIEVLIATAIMVSALIALVYGLTQSSILAETARNQVIALNGAQEAIEWLANNTARIDTFGDGFNFPDRPDSPLLDLLLPPGQNYPGFLRITPVAEVPDNLYDVEATVTWQQRGGRQLSITLTTTLNGN